MYRIASGHVDARRTAVAAGHCQAAGKFINLFLHQSGLYLFRHMGNGFVFLLCQESDVLRIFRFKVEGAAVDAVLAVFLHFHYGNLHFFQGRPHCRKYLRMIAVAAAACHRHPLF